MSDLETRPGPEPRLVAALTVAVLLTFLVVGGTTQLLNLPFGLWFSEVFLFFAVTWVLVQVLGFQPGPALGLRGFGALGALGGLGLGVVNHFAWALPLMVAAHAVFPKSLLERFVGAQVFAQPSALETAAVAVVATVVASFCEEVFFRGFLQRALLERLPPARAIVITALVFSAFHLDPVGFVARFQLGVLFGVLAWRSGSVWPAVGAHVANNGTSVALYFLRGDAPSEEAMAWWVPVVYFAVGNVLLLALARAVWPVLPVARPAAWLEGPRAWGRQAAAWATAAVLIVGALLVFDWRGVQLNVVEVLTQAPKGARSSEAVRELRARVRRGEAPLAEYEAVLKLAKQAEKARAE